MKKKTLLKSTLFFLLIITIIFFKFIKPIIDFIVWFIFINENEIKNYIISTATVLSVILFAKRMLYDTNLISNITKEIGKKSLYNSLNVLHKLIKILGAKETIKRIKLIDGTELEMKEASKELVVEIYNKNNEIKPDFKMSRKTNRRFNQKINRLLTLIDKQLDIDSIEKNIGISKRRNERRNKFINQIKEKGKNITINNFSNRDN